MSSLDHVSGDASHSSNSFSTSSSDLTKDGQFKVEIKFQPSSSPFGLVVICRWIKRLDFSSCLEKLSSLIRSGIKLCSLYMRSLHDGQGTEVWNKLWRSGLESR
ncbi:unnamed protein product [Brassica oleracea var. botrytis]